MLAPEVSDFTRDCYGPARAKLFMTRPSLSATQMHDVTWIGSSYFVGTAGFYDSYRSRTLVLLIGTYDLKTVVTVSVVQFALLFTDFWFQLARWNDSTILDALYGWGWGWNRPHTNFGPCFMVGYFRVVPRPQGKAVPVSFIPAAPRMLRRS